MKSFRRITTALCLALALIVLSACDGINIGTEDSSKPVNNASSASSGTQQGNGEAIKALNHYNIPDKLKGEMDTMAKAIMSGKKSVDLSGKISSQDVHDLFYIIKYTAYSVSNFPYEYVVYTNGYSKVTKLDFKYNHDSSKGKSLDKSLKSKVSSVMSGIPKKADDYEKVKYFHDYLVKNCEYEKSATNEAADVNFFTAYGALVEGKAVCEGYAKAFSLLCDEAGIDSFCLVGDAGGPHMWNMVFCDGEWYCMDVTWDDPVGNGDTVSYAYFNLTGKEMNKTHTQKDNIYLKIPEATATKDNYFKKNNFIAYDYDGAKKLLSDQAVDVMKKGGGVITIKLASQKAYNDTKKGLFQKQEYYPIANEASKKAGKNDSISKVNYTCDDKNFVININI